MQEILIHTYYTPHAHYICSSWFTQASYLNSHIRGVARRRSGSTEFNIFPSVLKLNGQILKRISFAVLSPFLLWGNSLREQLLSFKSRPYFRKETIRNLQKSFPLAKMVEGADLYHMRMISLGGYHILLYISQMLASI